MSTGYRIGAQCFESYEQAADYQMSQVLPVITSDGKLLHPVKQNGKWHFAGHEIKPNFPSCSAEGDIGEGMMYAAPIVTLMAVAYCFRFLSGFVYRSFMEPDERGGE